MKFIFKVFKYLFLLIIILILLGLTTVFVGHKFLFPVPFSSETSLAPIQEDGFCFGVECQAKFENAEEFIPEFAKQVKTHNQIAADLWPNNSLVNLHAVVQSIEKKTAWHITPQGEISLLSKAELKALVPARTPYDTGFIAFENDSIKGVYLAISEKGVKNVSIYEKYQYLGTYDLFLTYSHEMFHIAEQDTKWSSPDEIFNRGRDERYDDVEARIIRNQLFNKVLKAVSAIDNETRDTLTRQVLTIYEGYKKNFAEDYKSSIYFDRIEGTAHYYELLSSLYAAYPEQVYSAETLDQALTVLARNIDRYQSLGLVSSGYQIGAWVCILLDKWNSDNPDKWKDEIIKNGNTTPLSILAEGFGDFELATVEKIDNKEREKIIDKLEKEKNYDPKPRIFQFFYQLIF